MKFLAKISLPRCGKEAVGSARILPPAPGTAKGQKPFPKQPCD